MTAAILTEPIPLVRSQDGVLRITGTRVPLDTVVEAFRTGSTPEEIAQDFSSLALGDIYAVIAYYLRHRDEVGAYLAEREEKRSEVRRENEARFSYGELRERLLARRNSST